MCLKRLIRHDLARNGGQPNTLGSTSVPASVPTGIYYFGLYLRDPSDGSLGNNSAWSPYGYRVRVVHCYTPPDYDATLNPSAAWQTRGPVSGDVAGCQVFRVFLRADWDYDFSLCSNDGVGGIASPGDGDFQMYDPAGTALWYIDGSFSCGYDASTLGSSYHAWSPPTGGYYFLRVSEFYASSMNFTLAYRGIDSQPVFSDGFESGNTSAW